ncbi:hypothetical protein [Hutsoniella sourekii]|uniref:hypothetical protein n=1 Tax=Hutsoniella sourekii TaxID=87650 RepID=UPI000486171A|nr:hypothetical protein [Hutsoniella sourekii]
MISYPIAILIMIINSLITRLLLNTIRKRTQKYQERSGKLKNEVAEMQIKLPITPWEVIEEKCLEKGWNLKELSKVSGVDIGCLESLEYGTNIYPDKHDGKKLSDVLEVSPIVFREPK